MPARSTPLRRHLLLLAVFCALVWAWSQWQHTPEQPDASATSASALGDITVAPPLGAAYDRADQFGDGWADLDGSGCDTRNEILARDLVDPVLDADGCTVLAGSLYDPSSGIGVRTDWGQSEGTDYTRPLDFLRGVDTSTLVQIDHIVPLRYAIDHGAGAWTRAERVAFANDPANLRAVYGSENAAKGARGPGDWLPSNEAFHCEYVQGFLDVLAAYDLTIAPADAQAAAVVLATC